MSSINKLRLVITLFYLIVFGGLAAYDEPLDPGVQEMLSSMTVESIEPGNAWVAFMGFNAPSQETMYDHGKQRIAADLASLSGKDSRPFDDDDNDQRVLEFKGDPVSIGTSGKEGFLPYAASHAGEIAELIHDNHGLHPYYYVALYSYS